MPENLFCGSDIEAHAKRGSYRNIVIIDWSDQSVNRVKLKLSFNFLDPIFREDGIGIATGNNLVFCGIKTMITCVRNTLSFFTDNPYCKILRYCDSAIRRIIINDDYFIRLLNLIFKADQTSSNKAFFVKDRYNNRYFHA